MLSGESGLNICEGNFCFVNRTSLLVGLVSAASSVLLDFEILSNVVFLQKRKVLLEMHFVVIIF